VAPARPGAAGRHHQAAALLVAQLPQSHLDDRPLVRNQSWHGLPRATEDLRQALLNRGAALVLVDAFAGAVRDGHNADANLHVSRPLSSANCPLSVATRALTMDVDKRP